MKIWLLTIGEPVPVRKDQRDRLHRTGFQAFFLANHGHDVTWWTSTFDHFRKKHFYNQNTIVHPHDHLTINMLHGSGYSRNVSFARFRDHRQIASEFARLAPLEDMKPDIVVAALPTIDLCREAVKYCAIHNVPVVLDMRDMWPDIFVDTVPNIARPIARILFNPLFREAREACAGATAIIGITDAFVAWGLARGNREKTKLDKSIPMGYISTSPSPEDISRADLYWDQQGIKRDSGEFTVCFFGTIGRQFDLRVVVDAARKLSGRNIPVKFVMCGSGDALEKYKSMAQDISTILFPGWIDRAAIHTLMRRSDAGLDPMIERYDFLATINNKAIEYMSAGLPILSSPQKGVLCDLLLKENSGMSFDSSDADGLAAIIEELAMDSDRIKTMGDNSRRLFESRFKAETVYTDLMHHYEIIRKWYEEKYRTGL